MISREKNPDYLNSFLDYMVTIQNKSPNTVKEYNYDLATFLKFIKILDIFNMCFILLVVIKKSGDFSPLF